MPSNTTSSAQPMPLSDKENRPPPPLKRRTSIEDGITALPMSRKLDQSPHLRPVDSERPHIPYKFRQFSSSQTSLQRQEATVSPTRPQTLRSRRSGNESIVPHRKRSNRKRKDEQLREEEIRAMSAPIPIPKRPGEGPLRRDSKKHRGAGAKESVVSLPHGESIHSTMSRFEQRGWMIGGFDVFNPRPAVRLSGAPQYIAPSSVPSASQTPSTDKQKQPEARGSGRKRDTIGHRADDLDASDLRTLLERDAKRREKRKQAQQEKLDQKLRARGGRNRGDSDKRRHEREAEEERRADEARRRAEQAATERRLTTPPTDIHPALRDQPVAPQIDAVGLGIGQSQRDAEAPDTTKSTPEAEQLQTPQNPFTDDAQPVGTPKSEELPAPPGAFQTITETPAEDDVVGPTDAAQTATPPLSPTDSARGTLSISQVIDSRRASDLPPPPPPPPITEDRRASDPKADRRPGTWGAFFRRGGTFARRQNAGNASPSEFSFSNTSRESMRNQPLPAHLVDTQMPIAKPRSKSGTPVRTQSKFREDLPELPMSPPDSRMPSPDVATAAIAAATAREAGKTQPVDIPRGREPEAQSTTRNDTPISPVRGHLMSASLASIGSEASWLASGGSAKRRSTQSALSRDMGSLSRHKEANASFEELGVDKDAEYIRRNNPSQDDKHAQRGHSFSGPAMAGASPDEESELDFDAERPETPGEPLTVHQSVRRKPTLVTRDPRVRSREGLLSEYTAEIETVEPIQPSSAQTDNASPVDFDLDAAEPEVRDASSVDYGKKGRGHARQVSAGSARLLDVKRQSTAASAPGSPTRQQSSLER